MAFEPKEFGLIIIESLRADDDKTGQKLFDAIIKYKTFEEPNLKRELHLVTTKQQFLETLELIYKKVCDDLLFPILHIEAHGYHDGLQLTSGEIISWDECMPSLRKINIVIENTLIIMLAACKGGTLGFRPSTSDRAPFRAVIGSLRDISPVDLLTAFEAFYTNYFFSLNPDISVPAMNEAINKPHTFGMVTSAEFFDDMLNADRDPEFFKQMVTDKAINEKHSRQDYANISLDILRWKWDCKLRQIFEEEKKNRDYFTMRDLRGNRPALNH